MASSANVWSRTTLWLTSESSQRLKELSLWSVLSWVLLVTLFTPLLVSCLRWIRTWRTLRSFPGPGGPFTFSLTLYRFCTSHPELDFNVGIMNLFYGLSRTYRQEKVFNVYIGPKPHIYVYSPEAVQAILSQSKNVDKTYVYSLLKEWMGNGLITSPGRLWKPRRRLITPAFHFRIVEDALGPINTAAKALTATISQLSCEEGLVNDLVPHVQRCSLRVICEAAMGVDIETLPGSRRYVKAVVDVSESFTQRFVRPWLWNPWLYYWCTSTGRREWRNTATIRKFSLQAIEKRKRALLEERSSSKLENGLAEPKKRRQCFMDILLDMHLRSDDTEDIQDRLSLEDIREEVDTFMFAGHDTTTAGISFCLFLLGHSPEVQQKLYEELQEVFQDSDRPVTLEDIKELKYLDCVIKESMRLYPPVPVIGRTITEEIKIEGRVVPVGCEVLLFLLALHQDPTLFPEPEKFDPDRFLPENAKSLHPFAFLPFSAGQRNCIGQRLALIEMKVVLATIVRECQVTSLDARDKLQLAVEIVLRSKTPLRLRFQPRRRR